MNQNSKVESSNIYSDYINADKSGDAASVKTDSYEIEKVNVKRLGASYIYLAGTFKNGDHILIRASFSSITESAALSNQFFLYISLVAALIGFVVMYFVSNRFLGPITVLTNIAKRMSELDFTAKYEVKTEDEVGVLGNSMNMLSETLEQALAELKEANTELKKDLEKKEQIDAMRKEFLSNVSHELKTPMTSIIGYSDTLLHVKVDEERQNKALLHIHEECRRLERLSGKLMSLIGLYDNDSIRMEEVDIEELFAGVAQLEKYQLEEKGMRLETRAAGQKRMLDRDLFESLLINLIDNAVKAGKEGDSILLEATEGGISVTDHGKGIPEEEISRVTEAFYMVDKSRSKKAGGIGLGLALCSQIAALHHGRLHIESKVGQGTRVSILFE